jgi:hypothetical protein
MSSLWSALVPLIIGSALVPIQIIITILLLRSAAGKRTAVAWVAGMTTVRLAQGIVFGLILSSSGSGADATGGDSSVIVASILLVVAVLLLVTGVRQLLTDVDLDAPPPKWLTATEVMGPGKAFGFGAGLLAIGAKFWIFTLGAIAAIGDADLGRTSSILTFLAFVALAEGVHVVVLTMAFVAPTRSDAALASASDWLTRRNRTIVIVISLVFGVWFLVKALDGLGVL